jgi:hypothetical protein
LTVYGRLLLNRVVQKLQFLNNFRLKTAKCTAFAATCGRTHKVVEQVQYQNKWTNGLYKIGSDISYISDIAVACNLME